MELVEAAILLVCLVVAGNVIGHFLPMIPDALIQITLGLILALTVHVTVPVATDWFMLLFIAPILYNDGRHFPRRALWALRGQIFSNAVFLVFATMFLGGWLIHWLVPAIPLAAGIALGALLAPTDPIAVEGIAKRVRLPGRVLHLVAGESLINDASGLIGFKYAIAAAVSGTFVFANAARDFLYIAIVGAIAGAALMAFINWVRKVLLAQGIGDPVVHTVLQMVTPFIIYFIAEEVFHASGVIAVVIAGLMTDGPSNSYMNALPELKLISSHAWDILVYVLNGLIFILLGIELPVAMRSTLGDHAVSTFSAIAYVLVIYFAVIALRFAWIFINDGVSQRRKGIHKPHLVSALLSAFAGARGAITVVGVLAVPTVLESGRLFPQRSLMLFIAAGVTVTSLVVASIALPLLASLLPSKKAKTQTTGDRLNYNQAKDYVLRNAIVQIKHDQTERLSKPALDLIGEFQRQQRRIHLNADESGEAIPPILRDELEIKIMGTSGEVQAIKKLRDSGEIDDQLCAKYMKRLESKLRDMQYLLTHGGRRTLGMRARQVTGRIRHRIEFISALAFRTDATEYRYAAKVAAKGALANIDKTLKSPEYKHRRFNKQVISTQIVHYRNRIETVRSYGNTKYAQYAAELQRLRMLAFTAERAAVHELMEQSYITPIMAQRLSSEISYSENAVSLRAAEADD